MLTIILDALAYIAAICVLVTVHEFGHFWVARRLGFAVARFSVGFGPPLWQRTGRDGTEYWLSTFPLGGYVKLLDEREGPVPEALLPKAFTRRPHWQRILVLLAGPGFNFIFAIVVLAGLFMINGISDLKPQIGEVTAGTPAARAGLRKGDEIIAIDGRAVDGQNPVMLRLLDDLGNSAPIELQVRGSDGAERSASVDLGAAEARRRMTEPPEPQSLMGGLGFEWFELPGPAVLMSVLDGPAQAAGLKAGDEIVSFNAEPITNGAELVARIRSHPGESVAIHYRRAGSEFAARLQVISKIEEGKAVGHINVTIATGASEIPPGLLRHVQLNPLQSVAQAGIRAWEMVLFQGRTVWRILTGQFSVKNINGPITIAQVAGDSAAQGFGPFIEFLVQISLALGFMNLLPIPILDGGQVLMQAIEWLKGKPLSERALAAGQQVGLAMVVLLLGIALFNDIVRQIG